MEVVKGSFSVSWGKIDISGNRCYIVSLPFQIWLVTEWISYWLVRYIVSKEKGKFDIINFHIAYPLCTHLKGLNRSIHKPVVITEHWSAYHYHFGIKGSKKLEKIKRIFGYADKIITISEALRKDIIDFSGNCDLDFAVVPNIVDTEIFHYEPRQIEQLRFFMVSQWKYPKNPVSVISAFKNLKELHPDALLRIGGYGPQENEIKQLIDELSLTDSIFFLGKLNSQQIAEEMRCATALVHLSEYETFSVVCAESICCGCPVIASNVGGIREFINDENGVLLEIEMMGIGIFDQFLKKGFDRSEISKKAHNNFSSNYVGGLYHQVLLNVLR